MDGGCWEYFRTFTGIPLLVLYHLWGVRALIWLQIGLRCGLFNPAAFQSQEVASEHVARMSIIPRPQIATPRASWRESLTQAVCLPVQLPYSLHSWEGRPAGSCLGMQVCRA